MDEEEANAIEAIRDVARRYLHALDTHDIELLRSCYHAGAHENHNEYDGDVEGFCAHLLESKSTTESTRQTIRDIAVHLDGDRAESRTSCVAVIRTRATEQRPRPKQITVELEYIDTVERHDGVWGTVHRTCVPGRVIGVEDIVDAA